jgi:hypothetical protein
MTRTEPPKAAGPAFGGPGQRRSLVGAGLFSLYLKRYLNMSKDIVAKLKKLAGGKAEDDTKAVATAPTLAVGTVTKPARPKPQWLTDMEAEEAEEAAEAADHEQGEEEDEDTSVRQLLVDGLNSPYALQLGVANAVVEGLVEKLEPADVDEETEEEDEDEHQELLMKPSVAKRPAQPNVNDDIDIDALAEKVAAKVLLHLANAIRHLPL